MMVVERIVMVEVVEVMEVMEMWIVVFDDWYMNCLNDWFQVSL